MVVLLNRKILIHLILLSWSSAQNINTNGNNNQTIQAGQQGSSLVSINSEISSIQATTSSNEAIASAPSFSGSSLRQLSVLSTISSSSGVLSSLLSSALSTSSSTSTSIFSSSISSSSFSYSSTTTQYSSSSSSSSSFTTSSSESSFFSSSQLTTSPSSSTTTTTTSQSISSFSSSSSSISSSSSSTSSSSISSPTSSHFTQSTTYPSTDPRHIVTSVIHGKTVYSNYYTTITYSATATSSANNKNSSSGHKGLSKKNRNIVIGCVVGIGVPLLILIAVIIYIFCIQSKKTNFIDSNGKVVTAYKRNKVMKLWYSLIGKNVSDEEYESKSPLGSAASDEEMILDDDIIEPSTVLNLDDEMNHGFVNRNETTLTSNTNNTNRSLSNKYNGTNRNINGQEGSNDLVIPEEKYYDEHGNELNAKNY